MSVEISDGTRFYTWSAGAGGDLELATRTSGPDVAVLRATAEGRIGSRAYTNAGDPANLGYEMLVVDAQGALQRINGHFASFQSLLAASGIGNTGINLPQIQRDYATLSASVGEMGRAIAALTTSANATAALVGGQDVLRLSTSLASLRETVSRISSPAATTASSTPTFVLGAAVVALAAAVVFLFLRK